MNHIFELDATFFLMNLKKEQESQSSIEIEILKDQMRNFQESLDESKQNKDYLEQDLKNLRQQLDYSQEELYKQKTNVNNKLQEREAEIEKLRTQVIKKTCYKF